MFLCLRVDLDYVPWDSPDAKEFGHAEPAVLIRLLDLVRAHGQKLHFFASNRCLSALPAEADAVLNEGHDLDWLCKHPENATPRYARALPLFEAVGHKPMGLAVKAAWPEGASFEGIEALSFLSAASGISPPGLRLFPVEGKSAREALRSGSTVKGWSDTAKMQIREAASRQKGVTIVVRPQVLGKFDPKLLYIREILTLAEAVGAPLKTLRDVMKEERAEG
jgi:hypothetical protein